MKEGLLINIHNGAMKQYYYNVIKELHDIGLGDMSTTEDFYYNIQHCYEIMLNVSECVDYLIEIKEKEVSEFIKGLVCLGIAVVLFLLADVLEINSFKELF